MWPLPYCFVLSDCASACVSCVVSFDGFTPVSFAAVIVVDGATVVVVETAAGGAASSFFSCPGALAEFPGAPPPLPLLPLPFPFPADAVPANARTLRTSTQVLVSRILISPFPTTHVTGERDAVHRT